MSLLDDVRYAMKVIEDERVPRGTGTIHHPNCVLLKPDAEARGLKLLDCNCGGWSLAVPIR